MPQESLVDLLSELYTVRPEAREYLEFWMNPDEDKLLEDKKAELKKIFFLPSGLTRRKIEKAQIRKIHKYFFDLSTDPDMHVDLLLTIVENFCSWITARGTGKSHFKTIEAYLNDADILMQGSEVHRDRFALRRERVGETLSEVKRILGSAPPPRRRFHRRFF